MRAAPRRRSPPPRGRPPGFCGRLPPAGPGGRAWSAPPALRAPRRSRSDSKSTPAAPAGLGPRGGGGGGGGGSGGAGEGPPTHTMRSRISRSLAFTFLMIVSRPIPPPFTGAPSVPTGGRALGLAAEGRGKALTSLRVLDLSDNQLTGVPTEFRTLDPWNFCLFYDIPGFSCANVGAGTACTEGNNCGEQVVVGHLLARPLRAGPRVGAPASRTVRPTPTLARSGSPARSRARPGARPAGSATNTPPAGGPRGPRGAPEEQWMAGISDQDFGGFGPPPLFPSSFHTARPARTRRGAPAAARWNPRRTGGGEATTGRGPPAGPGTGGC